MRKKIKARDLQLGQVLQIPGAEMHDDLAGLLIELRVDGLEYTEKTVIVLDKYSGSRTWFRLDEEVTIY